MGTKAQQPKFSIGDRVEKLPHQWNDNLSGSTSPHAGRVGTIVRFERDGSQPYFWVEWPPGREERHHSRTLRLVSPAPAHPQKPAPASDG